MKIAAFISILVLCIMSLFQAGIIDSLLMFLIAGIVPGTTLVLSPFAMIAILSIVCVGGILVITRRDDRLPLVEPRLVKTRKNKPSHENTNRRRNQQLAHTTLFQRLRRVRRQLHRRLRQSIQPKAVALRERIAVLRKDQPAPRSSESLL